MSLEGELRDAAVSVRAADEQLASLNPRPFPIPARGLEAVIAGGFSGVERSDWVFPGLRERVGATLRGCPLERLVDPADGAKPYRIAPTSGDPAARMLHACGVAMADPEGTTLCFIGQGSASYGAFHEALNLAALRWLNVIFVASTWELTDEAPLGAQTAADISALAAVHGLRVSIVDGADAEAVRAAVADARAAGGPTLIEARLTPGVDPLATSSTSTADLSTLSVAALKAMAKTAGVSGYSRMKKADLIQALT